MGARKTRLTPLDPKYLEEIGPAKVGRPRFEATQEHREKVKTLAAQGVSQKEIAAILRIDTDTLIRECREDWEMGRAIGIANVQGVNYKRAMSGDHGSFQDRQFYLINVAGMSSGATLHAAQELARTLDHGNVVVLFGDRGERYFSTPIFGEA